jgi:CDP-diacylglycerol--glycerol-3-phosphate 3-phosphatidyltransferase
VSAPGEGDRKASGLISDDLDQRFTRSVAPMIRRLILARVSPDAITVTAFVVTLGSALCIGNGGLFVGGLLLLVGGAFDFMDGKVAVLTGRATTAGAILDSTLDRYSDAALCIGLMLFFASGGHSATAVAAVIALAGSSVTSYVKAQADVYGYALRAGILRRQDRVVLLASGLLLSPLHALIAEWLAGADLAGAVTLPNIPAASSVWLLAVLTNVSAMQRLLILRGLARDDTASPARGTGHTSEAGGLRERQLRTLRSVIDGSDLAEEGRRDEN